MRVGFITAFAWERYGPRWVELLRSVDAEVVLPTRGDVLAAGERLEVGDGLVAWFARASLRALSDVDLVVVPSFLGDGGARSGSAQDPWIADMAAMLAATERATVVHAVPSETGPAAERVVIPLLTRVQRDAGRARRAWDRHRIELLRPWSPPSGDRPRADAREVAFAASPWWCGARLADALARPGERMGGQHRTDPSALRAEGHRWLPGVGDPDAETLGAVRRFARRHEVAAVRLAYDPASAAQAWLVRRAREVAGDRLELVALDASPSLEALVDALLPVDVADTP